MEHETHTSHTSHAHPHEEPVAPHVVHHRTPKRTNIALPIAIVVAGIVVAGAILFSNGTFKNIIGNDSDDLPQFGAVTESISLAPFDPATDHIIGNPNAPVIIIEYSDFNCPYCQVFHHSMKELMAEHGATGQVAWVYRNLPIITQDSPAIAHAAECAADAGGNDAFWKFTDTLFEREQGTRVDLTTLSTLASSLGIDKATFEACTTGAKHQSRIQALMDNVIALGVNGTPATFAIVKGTTYPIEGGALPYTQLTQALAKVIDEAKKQ